MAPSRGCPLQVNLATGEGLRRCFTRGGALYAVINTAAMSSPGACEKDHAAARYPTSACILYLEALLTTVHSF